MSIILHVRGVVQLSLKMPKPTISLAWLILRMGKKIGQRRDAQKADGGRVKEHCVEDLHLSAAPYLAQSDFIFFLLVRYFSADSAAMQPLAAAITTCLTSVHMTSPAA